jgi:hypothetical protein
MFRPLVQFVVKNVDFPQAQVFLFILGILYKHINNCLRIYWHLVGKCCIQFTLSEHKLAVTFI